MKTCYILLLSVSALLIAPSKADALVFKLGGQSSVETQTSLASTTSYTTGLDVPNGISGLQLASSDAFANAFADFNTFTNSDAIAIAFASAHAFSNSSQATIPCDHPVGVPFRGSLVVALFLGGGALFGLRRNRVNELAVSKRPAD